MLMIGIDNEHHHQLQHDLCLGMMIIIVIMIMMFDRLQSLTLLSPVDGLDPFGLVPIYCITPGEMLNFR